MLNNEEFPALFGGLERVYPNYNEAMEAPLPGSVPVPVLGDQVVYEAGEPVSELDGCISRKPEFHQAPLWLENTVESPKSEARLLSRCTLFHDMSGSIPLQGRRRSSKP